MKWSKLKKLAEDLLAERLKNHVRYHFANYGRGDSTTMSRGWITVDGRKIANFSTVESMSRVSLYGEYEFLASLDEYVHLSVEAALKSNNPIVKAVAMFDRRFGLHRLESIQLASSTHPLVLDCYRIRCEAEGVDPRE